MWSPQTMLCSASEAYRLRQASPTRASRSITSVGTSSVPSRAARLRPLCPAPRIRTAGSASSNEDSDAALLGPAGSVRNDAIYLALRAVMPAALGEVL